MNKLSKLKRDSTDATPNGYMATLLRKFLRNNVGIENIPSLIAKFNNFGNMSKDDLKISSSTINDIYKDKITFNSFVKIILNLLRPKRIRFIIEVEMESGALYKEHIEINKNSKRKDNDIQT